MLTKGEDQVLSKLLMFPYRAMFVVHFPLVPYGERTDIKVSAAAWRPLPEVKRRILRLAFFQLLITWAPVSLIALLHITAPSPRSWLAMVRQDSQWLYFILEAIEKWDKQPDFQACADYVAQAGKSWKALLRRAQQAHVASLRAEDATNEQLARLAGEAREARITFESPHVVGPCWVRRSICDKRMRSQKALTGHRYKVHGIKNRYRLYVVGPECPACFAQFYTMPRALYHVAYSAPACRAAIFVNTSPVSDEEAEVIDREDEKQRKVASEGEGHEVGGEAGGTRCGAPSPLGGGHGDPPLLGRPLLLPLFPDWSSRLGIR